MRPLLPPLVALVLVFGVATAAHAQAAVDNPHGAIELPCETCHSAEGWDTAGVRGDFDHDATGFELEGAHGVLECTDCHVSLRFDEASPDCGGCHLDVHRAELGTDCAFCHTTRSFLDRAEMRRMHRLTRFALTGSHAGVECEACHVPRAEGGLSYVGVSTECIDCHRAEYEAATDPEHVAGGFLERCDACHSTASFEGGFFNHERQLAGSSLQCVDCHRDDYDRTTNPDHAASGFPLQCDACHGTRSWYGQFFAHDDQWFPIFSGRHREEWNDCSDCHTVASDFRSFECLQCHEHDNESDLADKHSEVGDEYRYESVACYQCHPTGRND